MSQLTPIFLRLSRAPTQISPHEMEQIERYVVLLYQRTSAVSHVNEARKQLFTHNRKMENIPPTLHALEQHVKRVVFQAGHIWGQIYGAGRERKMILHGLHAGPLFQRQPNDVKNC